MTKDLRKICDEATEYVTKWFDSIEFEGRMEDHKHMDGEEVMYEQGENIRVALTALPTALDLIEKLSTASGSVSRALTMLAMTSALHDKELSKGCAMWASRLNEALAAVKEFEGE